jgi:hypothetical protein
MLDLENVRATIEIRVAELNATCPQLLGEYPLKQYVGLLDSYPEVVGHGYVSREVRAYCGAIVKAHGEDVLERYHKLLLLTLIVQAQDRLKSIAMPEEVRHLYDANFQRIVRNIESETDPRGLYLQSHFWKEMSLCTLRLVPCGVLKVHLHGIPKRLTIASGFNQFVRSVRFILVRVGGFVPLYQMHLDMHDAQAMLAFTPAGWRRGYRTLAELLKLAPRVKGVFGVSWFQDPQLETISPELVYIRRLVIENGGAVFCVGPCNADGIKNATLRSRVRAKLYEDGKYTPTDYMVVWPRKELIDWADRQRGHESLQDAEAADYPAHLPC